jgi:hypothetical protein
MDCRRHLSQQPRLFVLALALALSAWTASGLSQTGTGTPFGGAPTSLPGTIQAENFNEGGEGVAYHDNSAANEGGQYRSTGVDIAVASDAGGGYTLGWVGTGEWLHYDVSVPAAGQYDIAVRVASSGAGGTFHIEVDGVDKTGSMTVPDTGGWQAWRTITKSGVELEAGRQVWRVVMDARGPSGAVGNINYFRVVAASGTEPPTGSTPFGGSPWAIPGAFQAEDFDNGGAGVAYKDTTPGNVGVGYRATDVDIAATASGYAVGWIAASEWLNYTVNVTASGNYRIVTRVASAGTGGTFHIEFGGVNKTGPLSVPNTGSWTTYTDLPVVVSLSAGVQRMRVVFDTSSPTTGGVGNLSYFNITKTTAPPTWGGSTTSPTPFGGSPWAIPGAFQAEDFDNGGAGVAYRDTTPGNVGVGYRATDVDIAPTSGGYAVGWIAATEWLHYTVNVTASGNYRIVTRVASNGAGGTFHIEFGGVNKTGPLSVPNTGGWFSYVDLPVVVSLSAGVQSMRVVFDTNSPTTGGVGNLSYFNITRTTAPAASAPVRGPYLQQVSSQSAVVVWTTRVSGSAAVRYATTGRTPVSVAAQTRFFRAADTGLAYDAYQHEARLTGLSASTRYTFDLLLGGVDTTAGQEAFTTAPPTGSGTARFIAFGDSGVGSTQQLQLADRMAADTFDLALHGGDVAYGTSAGLGGASYRQYEDWFFSVYAAWLKARPMFPSMGNHDTERAFGQAYLDVYVLPENGESPMFPDHAERYYSFDYGPAHFIALDTERAFQDPARRAAQLAWLDADLAATSQPWKVVYFHRSPYSAGTHHGSDLAVRNAFAPLFERHGVDLAISAHEHDYERSIPWREFEPLGEPVVYVVSGGGGGPLHPAGKAAWTARSMSIHHYVKVSISGCTLTGQAIGVTGSVLDSFSIDRCSASAAPLPSLEGVIAGRR